MWFAPTQVWKLYLLPRYLLSFFCENQSSLVTLLLHNRIYVSEDLSSINDIVGGWLIWVPWSLFMVKVTHSEWSYGHGEWSWVWFLWLNWFEQMQDMKERTAREADFYIYSPVSPAVSIHLLKQFLLWNFQWPETRLESQEFSLFFLFHYTRPYIARNCKRNFAYIFLFNLTIFSMNLNWIFHESELDYPWIWIGFSIIMNWIIHESELDFPWIWIGFSRNLNYIFHESELDFSMKLNWIFHESEWDFPWILISHWNFWIYWKVRENSSCNRFDCS